MRAAFAGGTVVLVPYQQNLNPGSKSGPVFCLLYILNVEGTLLLVFLAFLPMEQSKEAPSTLVSRLAQARMLAESVQAW